MSGNRTLVSTGPVNKNTKFNCHYVFRRLAIFYLTFVSFSNSLVACLQSFSVFNLVFPNNYLIVIIIFNSFKNTSIFYCTITF